MHGFVGNREEITIEAIEEELANPTDRRIFAIAEAFHKGYSVDDIYERTKIDRWFLHKLEGLYKMRCELKEFNKLEEVPDELLLQSKKFGFSDFQLARFVLKPGLREMHAGQLTVREYRKNKGITPFIKQIDTLAGEYPAQTKYLIS